MAFRRGFLVLLVVSACCLLASNCNALSVSSSKPSKVPVEAATTAATSFSAPSRTKECVVVGGGPIGLAAALTLSRPPHGYRVTVLERGGAATYNPARSFLYNINSRGLSWFQQQEPAAPFFAHEELKRLGVPPDAQGRSSILRVAADPQVPIAAPTLVSMGGPLSASNATMSYWIQRHETVDLLARACALQNDEMRRASGNTTEGFLTVLDRKCVQTLTTSDEDGRITVSCDDGTSYTASLVVAADGIESAVRKVLAGTSEGCENNQRSWLQSRARKFRVRKWNSPSTGLQLKSLQFPPDFSLTNTSGEVIQSHPTTLYSFQGLNTGPRNRLSIGMLPLKQAGAVARPGNTIGPHDHEVWQQRNGTAARTWFQRNFPRLPWATLISDAEWDRYAKAPATIFPPCQYSPGSAVVEPERGQTGVVLVGDACHAFPPDIGQGINSGLMDVVALDRALSGCDIATGKPKNPQPSTLGDALLQYQANRGPEHRALIRLVRFGAPFQYSQPWRRHRLGKQLWTVNVILRALLNKASAGWIPGPAALMVYQNPHLSFRSVMRRADFLTLCLKAVLAAVSWKIIGPRIALPRFLL